MIRIDATKTSAAVAKVTRRLDKLAAELGTRYTCVVALPTDESRNLSRFDSGTTRQPARPVFRMSPQAREEITAAVRARFAEAMLRGDEPSMLPVMTVAGNAFRRVWVRRLETSGDGEGWAPLSPRYLAWKRRKGLDTRIGVARGRMLAAVRSGQIVVRKA